MADTLQPTDHLPAPTRYDVAVIGGGLAGLCAAIPAARAGATVTVIERNPIAGGRARTDGVDGFRCNLGPHALYVDGPGHRRLQRLGVDPAGVTPPLAGSRALTGSATGATELLPVGPASVLRTRLLGLGGRLAAARLFATIGRVDATAHRTTSASDWIAGQHPQIRPLLAGLARLTTYSADLDALSAEAVILQLQASEAGVRYLHGGWQALVDALVATARAAGAEVRTGGGVRRVERRNGRFLLTGHDGRMVDAGAVVVAAGGPALAARLLDVSERRFGEVGRPVEAATMDLGLARPPGHRFVLGIDEPLYFSVHSPPADLAPEATVAAVAMRYLSPDDDGSTDDHRASLDRVAAAAGVDSGSVISRRFLRRMTVTHGQPLASTGGLAGRPDIAVPDLPGAFVAGDWVGPVGLLADASICSGARAGEAAAAAAVDRVRLVRV